LALVYPLNWFQFVSIGEDEVDGNEPEESYLTVAEVAGMLKLNQQTVRNWIDQGSLPAVRVGRRVRIKRSDFERVVADGYQAGSGFAARDRGPSGEDFWSGQMVGVAEPDPSADRGDAIDAIDASDGQSRGGQSANTQGPSGQSANAQGPIGQSANAQGAGGQSVNGQGAGGQSAEGV
jgi:excisionase family DNA binding protein